MKEWHEYDRKARRSRVVFRIQHPHFLFVDHKDLLHIQILSNTHGYVELKTRRRRSFFSDVLLPDTKHFYILESRPSCELKCPEWCESLLEKLHERGFFARDT